MSVMLIKNMARKLLRIFLLCVVAAPALADFDPDAYPRYETCALCHGLFGVSHAAKFPHLAGQNPAYIEAQLRAFIAGTRHNDGGQMAAIVTELQPGDIEVVVEWFSTQDPPEPTPLAQDNEGAAALEGLGCLACHASENISGDVPHLMAQHSGYLAKQMSDFRDGRRDAPEIAQMHRDALQLTDSEIDEIAAYLAAQER